MLNPAPALVSHPERRAEVDQVVVQSGLSGVHHQRQMAEGELLVVREKQVGTGVAADDRGLDLVGMRRKSTLSRHALLVYCEHRNLRSGLPRTHLANRRIGAKKGHFARGGPRPSVHPRIHGQKPRPRV